jgi:membrane protease subunit (stomatin/prohibitin family)
MGMAGNDMGRFMQYQTAQALPAMAAGGNGGGSTAGDALGLGAGMVMGQVLAQNLQQGLQGGASPMAGTSAPITVRADELIATLEKLGDLKAKGILTAEEFDSKKTQLLSRLT